VKSAIRNVGDPVTIRCVKRLGLIDVKMVITIH